MMVHYHCNIGDTSVTAGSNRVEAIHHVDFSKGLWRVLTLAERQRLIQSQQVWRRRTATLQVSSAEIETETLQSI